MARIAPAAAPQQIEKGWLVKLAVLFVVVVPFIGTLYAMVMLWNQWVDWLDVTLMLVLYVISGMGITVGFHRMLTHRSFEAKPWVKRLLLIAGTLAVEGDAMTWASTHIQHHAHSDGEDDPHSPLQGLWHSHVGWLFTHKNNIDVYGTWLKKDPDVVWVSKTWVLWVVPGIVIPTLIAGWSGLIWGARVRICLTHHITWSVN